MKKSHVRNFHAEASQKKISAPQKKQETPQQKIND